MGKLIDLTGRIYGKWTVLERGGNDKFGSIMWRCRCECGEEDLVRGVSLRTGISFRCVYCANPYEDLTNRIFGKLTVMNRASNGNRGEIRWNCECECGNTRIARSSDLKSGGALQCTSCKNKMKWLAPGETGFNILWGDYVKGAKARTLVFTLTKDQFRTLTSAPCYFCGKLPAQISSSKYKENTPEAVEHSKYIYNGIDRINNTKGYEEGNVVTCCGLHNYIKGAASATDIHLLSDGIKRFEMAKNYLPCQTGVCR